MQDWEKRLNEADKVISEYMKKSKIYVIYPEKCMKPLHEGELYIQKRKDALHFRKDLRKLRDTKGLPYETENLRIEQKYKGGKWFIYLKENETKKKKQLKDYWKELKTSPTIEWLKKKLSNHKGLLLTLLLFFSFIIFGLITDFKVNKNEWIIKVVKDDFIYSIFAAQFTIAALSGTLFTIITNSVQKKFGYSLNEILHLDRNHMSLNIFITISLVSIAVSSFFLALLFINTILFILFLFATILLVIIEGRQIYKSLFEIQYNYKVLDNSLKETSGENEIGTRLFQSFESEFENIINSNILEKYLQLLNQYIKRDYNKDNINNINEYLKRIVLNALENRDLKFAGYILDKIFEGTTNFAEYDRTPIIVSQYEKLEFYNSEKFIESHLPDFIRDFEDNDSLNLDLVENILDTYFNSLYRNELLSETYRYRFIETYINEMCHLYSKEEKITKIKERQIFRIVKLYAIEQSDINLFNRIISK